MYRSKQKGLLVVAIICTVYYLFSSSGRYSTYLLPTPQMLWHSFLSLMREGSLLKHVGISLQRVFMGFSLACLLATGLALLSYCFPKIIEAFDWLLQFIRNIPPLSLIPLLIIWLGIGETAKLSLIVLACFFPIYLNIEKGLTSCDSKLLEVGETLSLSKGQQFFRIILPHAFPDIMLGMRTGLGYAYRAIIAAEMIAASSGLGYMINFARSLSQTDVVVVGILVIGFLGYMCDRVFCWMMYYFARRMGGYGWH